MFGIFWETWAIFGCSSSCLADSKEFRASGVKEFSQKYAALLKQHTGEHALLLKQLAIKQSQQARFLGLRAAAAIWSLVCLEFCLEYDMNPYGMSRIVQVMFDTSIVFTRHTSPFFRCCATSYFTLKILKNVTHHLLSSIIYHHLFCHPISFVFPSHFHPISQVKASSLAAVGSVQTRVTKTVETCQSRAQQAVTSAKAKTVELSSKAKNVAKAPGRWEEKVVLGRTG